MNCTIFGGSSFILKNCFFWRLIFELQNYKTILSQQHFLERNIYKK